MATKTVKRNDLVGLASLSFIRNIDIAFSVTDTKPLTRLYAFFDGRSVDAFITPTGGSLGGILTTNAAGEISGTFSIPPATFNTGERELLLQDSPLYDATKTPGATVGRASALFKTNGIKKTYQETITNTDTQTRVNFVRKTNFVTKVNTITKVNKIESNIVDAKPVPIVPPRPVTPLPVWDGGGGRGGRDPLAQTFFTYGVSGGCFITKIDIYFQSKDSAIPVSLEVRDVINGYPGPNIIEKHAVVSKAPSTVTISSDASIPTSFVFSQPLYLKEDSDYCFVLLANSSKYNIWTSKFGDRSIETGKTIFEQPYIGTLFKSENNVTWTAEQTEDIKFTIHKASFDTTAKEVTFKANAQPLLVNGEDFSVTSGSAVVTVRFKFQHGHKTGDKIVLTGIAGGTYRGIPSATISNVAGFTVTVIDDRLLTFNCGANATSTGRLSASGLLNAVVVDEVGSGYVAPSISITGGGGSGATASAVVSGGKIVSVNVTNAGSGFTSTPTLTLTDASGSGAELVPISETIFVVTLNRKYQTIAPIIFSDQPVGTLITNTIRSSDSDYVVGEHVISPINLPTNMEKSAVLVNPMTETTAFGSTASTQMISRFESDNPNVSPIIDLSEIPRLRMHNFLINSVSNNASETDPITGTALARYISKITTIETPSKGIRVFVNGASVSSTSFNVFVRTSLSSSSVSHRSGDWVSLTCDVERNLSSSLSEYKDYEFYLDGLAQFDVYDIKIVLYSEKAYEFPIIANYRSIILAT